MCGITGYWNPDANQSAEMMSHNASLMGKTLNHRGPNDAGTWVDENTGLAFGHRRLSILDLSPAGHQPMHSASGRYVIIFNGEIYNHLELRSELDKNGNAPPWKGHSDTETLLAAFESWGTEATLTRCIGMFAIALWDRLEHTLTLTRDRFGEKPLYYGWSNSTFLFGSELKALRAYPGFDSTIDREALIQYLRFLYVPSPRSIYKGIYKLEPGCILTIKGTPPKMPPPQPLRPGQSYDTIQLRRWWSLSETVVAAQKNTINDEFEAIDKLENRLSDAIARQMLSDVPLGAFLSGGVDSSSIVALMQQQSSRPVKTFTIGFDEPGYDESPHAAAVAHHLGTDHHEMRVTAQDAHDLITHLPHLYDEPFADSSQIPTHLVCQAARQKVTVALSGDAGDELFGGYNRYFWGPRIWDRFGTIPHPIRRMIGSSMESLPITAWNALSRYTNIGSGTDGVVQLGDKAHKLASRLRTVRSVDELYYSLVSEWQHPESLVRNVDDTPILEPPSILSEPLPTSGVEQAQLRMMYQDSMTYLPDDILCKVDRAAMAVSLETRVPFLDHHVVELAWSLPLHMKIRGNEGKWALRQVLYRHVPKELIERPKAGFAIPLGSWLRGSLRDWAESLLDLDRLNLEGYFNPEPIRKAWSEHLTGKRDHTHKLWAVLMFQAWLEKEKTALC